MRKTLSITAAALLLTALAISPASAAGAALCETAATVTLSSNENLTNVDGGSGTLAGSMACEGSVAGIAPTMSGSFAFCRHNSTTSHTAQCGTSPPAPQPPLEPLYNGLAPSMIISHVVGNISFSLNTGVSCSLSLNGHTIGIQADLDMKSFRCSNGFGGTTGAEIAQAHATAAIIVNPTLSCPSGPAPACFNSLAFAGVLIAIDQ